MQIRTIWSPAVADARWPDLDFADWPVVWEPFRGYYYWSGAFHRDHLFDRWTAARCGGLGAWLAGLARDRHPLPNMQHDKTGHTAEPALSARCRKTRWQKIGAAAVNAVTRGQFSTDGDRLPRPVPHHTRRSQGRLDRRRMPVIEDSCRTCPYPPQTLDFFPFPRTDVDR
jgi:hypothetical protein